MKLGMMKSVGAMALGVWLVDGALAGAAHAERTCQPTGDGQTQCEVGVRSEAMDMTAAAVGGQRMSQWCWAASIAMVFRHYGFEVSQQRIVAETFGEVVNMPGTSWQMLQALSREWTDDRGRPFRVTADAGTTAESAIEDLAAGHPLIVGTYGHAMVLTAVGYVTAPGWDGQVTGAVVRDPWPGNGRRALSPEEWNGADLLVRIRVADAGRGPAPVAKAPAVKGPVARPAATLDDDGGDAWDASDRGDAWDASDRGDAWEARDDQHDDGGVAWQAEDGAGEVDWRALLWMLRQLGE